VESSLTLGISSLEIPSWHEIIFKVGGIIFHALRHFQQLLACFWHFVPLEDFFACPRL
jgi:hypothetical protein